MSVAKRPALVLADDVSDVVDDIGQLSVLIHGGPKFGKTTMAAQHKGMYFLATEPGHNHVKVFKTDIQDWEMFLEALGLLRTAERFTAVCVDTVDFMYKMCSEYVCAQHKISDPSDMDYGKGFGLVNTEFTRVLRKMCMMGKGVWLISHSQEKTIEPPVGVKYTKFIPTMTDKCTRIVCGLVDVILYCDYEYVAKKVGEKTENVQKRVFRTINTKHYLAGNRIGLADTIPFGYEAFIKAVKEAKANRLADGTIPAGD